MCCKYSQHNPIQKRAANIHNKTQKRATSSTDDNGDPNDAYKNEPWFFIVKV